jgi:hypothetical protein
LLLATLLQKLMVLAHDKGAVLLDRAARIFLATGSFGSRFSAT